MQYILVLNAGSSSLKANIFNRDNLKQISSIQVERVGLIRPFLIYKYGNKTLKVNFNFGIKNHNQAFKEFIKILPDNIYNNITIVGHRIVHGGEEFVEPQILNKSIIKRIAQYNSFAPIHNPINLKTVLSALSEFPKAKQIGVFDTQFFKDLAEYIYLFSIPIKYYEDYGLRKFGFHGLSHENMLTLAQQRLGKKSVNLVTCHIGNGVSITAIKDGKVFDTSMGLTPLSGPTMGTRSGDLDPFIPLYLIKECKMSSDEVYKELNFKSGLKGICGVSDFRDILYLSGIIVSDYKSSFKRTKRKKDLARLALRIYIYDLQRYVASYAGLLGQVDAIIFSGGVGQNRAEVRDTVLKGVTFANRPKIFTVKSDEALIIAQKCIKTLKHESK